VGGSKTHHCSHNTVEYLHTLVRSGWLRSLPAPPRLVSVLGSRPLYMCFDVKGSLQHFGEFL
jgi:hypothetical protein